MIKTKDRIERLRKKMLDKGIDAYIIPSSDPHMSEYLADHWTSREWLSGFTGSAGTLVITFDFGGLWTDGRYYIQAEQELKGTGIKLFKMGSEGVPGFIDWLGNSLNKNSCVGIDGRLFSISQVRNMEKKFSKAEITLCQSHDLLRDIWMDRPERPRNPIFIHDIVYAGKTAAQKIQEVRNIMKRKGVNYHLISSLDDIAWLFNIRGTDVSYNPVAISYALISDEKAWIYIDEGKISRDVRAHLNKNGVEIDYYKEIEAKLTQLNHNDTILLDPDRTNNRLGQAIPDAVEKSEDMAITTRLKAIKNQGEIDNLKNAHIRDGVAMVKFLYWLDRSLGNKEITEITIAQKLEEYRSRQENYMGLSFPTIAGYRDHGAIVHYKATEESVYSLEPEGMLLIDSGCQYLDGTTDITRTIILGTISDEERRDYTLVLKGNINLTQIKFPRGTTGANLDVLARMYLWGNGIDYKHGTGHGVGYFLNVHEGPHGIHPKSTKTGLKAGMIVTNEPGVYRENRYGIRLENELLVVEDETTEFGQFLRFEPITYCPFDLKGIAPELLDQGEKNWLNDYHNMVYNILSPLLNREESLWLKDKTRAWQV